MKSRNIILFSLTDPFERQTGYSQRVQQVIKALKVYNLHIITFDHPDRESEAGKTKQIKILRLKQERYSIIKVLTGYGISSNQAFYSRENFQAVEKIIQRLDPECIIMEGFYFSGFLKLKCLRQYPVVMDLHNNEVKRLLSSLRSSLTLKQKVLTLLGLINYIYSQVRSKKYIKNFWIPTQEEKEKISRLFRIGPEIIYVIPNCLISEERTNEHNENGSRRSLKLLFVGNYSYAPNEEAAVIIVKRLLPKLRKYFHDISCCLAGPNPPTWLKSLNGQGVTVPGYVPDLSSLFREASLFIAPILSGGGIKYKVIQALSAGVPVIGTNEAFSGIDFSGTKYIKPVKIKSFCSQIAELLENEDLYKIWGQEGKELAEEQLSFNKVKSLISNSIQTVTSASAV